MKIGYRLPRRIAALTAVAALFLGALPAIAWADPVATPSPGLAAKSGKPTTSKTATPNKRSTTSPKPARLSTDSDITSVAPGVPDLSAKLPRTARDMITGDFMGLGYDQWARAEGDPTGTYLNIYNPPSKGGNLIRHTLLDIGLPDGSKVWETYGNLNGQGCGGCFAALDNLFHLLTIQLATDGRYIYISGITGADVNWPDDPDDPNQYQNWLYVVDYDGHCASKSCAKGYVSLPHVYEGFDDQHAVLRAVATTSLAAAVVGGTSFVAAGMTDYGVQFYSVKPLLGGTVQLSLTSDWGGMYNGTLSQTPTTALALDSSGTWVAGVTTYGTMGFAGTLDANGNVTETAYWERTGAPGAGAGEWTGTPVSAAIGMRPDGKTKTLMLGMSDGYLYYPDFGGSAGYITRSPYYQGTGPVTITPIPRLDGLGTDYAISVPNGADVTTGTGYLLRDDGTNALKQQVIGVDGSGKASVQAPSFDAYRTWFPGYKQGTFQIKNTLDDPIKVTLHAGPDPTDPSNPPVSYTGCWFAPTWNWQSQFPTRFPTSTPVIVGAGQTSANFTMGALTAGADGSCSYNPTTNPGSTWRGYLEIAPASRPAETRLVDIKMSPDGWTVDTTDQKGGSLTVQQTSAGIYSALGNQTFTVQGASAPVALSAPSLTGNQLTPTGTGKPTVYRFDVGPTTWQVGAPGATTGPVQAVLPPLQVVGQTSDGKWNTNVGLLMPNGKLNVGTTTLPNGTTVPSVTAPGASFYWENVGGISYTGFEVVAGGSTVGTSSQVTLGDLSFCYRGPNGNGACGASPLPDISSVGFSGTPALQVLPNGLDQSKLSTVVNLTAAGGGGTLAGGDDAYNKIFYRSPGAGTPLITNLWRQDDPNACTGTTAPNDCFQVGVQPSPGAYQNTGPASAVAKRGAVRGSVGSNAADYASTTSSGGASLYAALQLKTGTSDYKPSGVQTLVPYNVSSSAVGSPLTMVAGFGLAGCVVETKTGSCGIAPTSTARAAMYAVSDPAGTGQPMVGMLFANQAQNADVDLPFTWTDTSTPALEQPTALTGSNNNALWQFSGSALQSLHSQTWVVTHGQLVPVTICTKTAGC